MESPFRQPSENEEDFDSGLQIPLTRRERRKTVDKIPVSLERQIAIDLENIAGVGHVEIKELGGSIYSVNVSMETFEFSSYEKVIEKELELMKTIPDFTFNFNVTFVFARARTSEGAEDGNARQRDREGHDGKKEEEEQAMKIKLGTRVKLKPMPENHVGEEEGVLVHLSFDSNPVEEIELDVGDPRQMVTVLVDEKYRDGRGDDGLRECDATQVEWPPELRKSHKEERVIKPC